jgi:hypothetical protein
MKRSRRILASIPIAGSILVTSMVANLGVYFPARAAEIGESTSSTTPSTPSQQSTGNVGDTGVRLRGFEDGSVGIEGRREINSRLRNNELFFPSNIRVVKIGDIFTKGKSIEQLTQLLHGPIGSSIPITLYSTGHVVTVKSLMLFSADELRGKRELINSMSLVQINDIYTNWGGSNRNLCAMGNNNREQGNIICATSAYITGTEKLPFHFTAFYDDNLQGLGDALDYYARTGMFARFDTGLKNALDCSSKNIGKYTDSQCAALIKCAATVIKYGYTKEGQQIVQRLYEARQNFSTDSKVKILLERARLAQLQTDTIVAVSTFKELTDTCLSSASINPEVERGALVEVVAYAMSQKESELAVKAQSQVDEFAGRYPGYRILPAAQEELRLKASLADAYDLADHNKAVETLLKALTDYEGKSTRDDTALADRIFTICPATVRFKLAYMSLRDGHQSDAKKYFEAGTKLWSEDLGSGAPNLEDIKNAEHVFAKEVTDKNNAELLSLLGKLPGVSAPTKALSPTLITSSTESDNDKQSYKQSREVYDAAVAGKGDVATQRLDALMKHESANLHHNGLDVAKLVNLVSASSTILGKSKVEEYLDHLASLFSKSNSLIEPAALYVRSEEIVLHDPKDETARWEAFDNYLTDIAEASGYAPSTLDDPKSRVPRLIEVSYSYAIRKEFASAIKFIQYIKLKYPEASENMSDVIAYEMTLQCLLGHKAEAEKSLDALLSVRSKRGANSRLVESTAAAFANTGNRTASLRVLQSTDSSPRDIHTNRQLAFYRALVYYKFGNYKEALAELSDSQNVMLSGETINELRRLRAELLVRNGQLDNGIQALCETAGDATVERLAFERDLELLKTGNNTSEPVVEKLLDYANRTQRGGRVGAQDSQLERALQELLKIAQRHQCPPSKIFSLQQRLGITTTGGAVQSPAANSKTFTTATTASNAVAPATTNVATPALSAPTPSAAPSSSSNASSNPTSKVETLPSAQTSYAVADAARQLIAAQKYQEGCAMFLRALQMDDGAHFNNNMYHYGNLKNDLSVQVLLDAKQFDVLETILHQALKTRLAEDSKLEEKQKTNGLLEKRLLCELYLEQGKYDEAKKLANEFVKALKESHKWCSTRRGAQDSSLHALNISIVRQFVAKKQFATARLLLDQLDGILSSKVGPKHVLLIEDNLTRAQLFEAEDKLDDAEKLAKEALDLDVWMSGTRATVTRNTYASILRKEGKIAAADAAEAVTDTDFKYDSKELYGNNIYSHSSPPVIFPDTAEAPLKKFLDNHVIQHGEGSEETQKAMDDLARFYVQKQRWNDAEKVQLRELKILDQMFGSCPEPKQSCFLNLAEIYKGKNDKRMAGKYVELITAPEESRFRDGSETINKLRLAYVLFFLGKKDDAIEMAKSVETSLLQKNRHWQVNEFNLFDDLIAFMKTADASSDANALEAEKIKIYGPRAASRTKATQENPSREQRQKDNLEKAQKDLADAEKSKEKEPSKYFYALLEMFTASISRNTVRSTEPQDGEKYFLSAVECFQQYAAKTTQPDSVPYELGNLWSKTRFLSEKTFASVFDRLCQCSKSIDDSGYRHADNEMLRALQDRERNMRGTEKKQYLQRAIDIRKADSGPKSKRLGLLYTYMAICCEHLGDTNGAEQNRLNSANLDGEEYEQVSRWLDLAGFYGRVHKADKEEANWRKAMEIANKNTLTSDARAWIPFIKKLQNEGHAKAADEIISFLLVRPDPNTLNDLDKYLSERIDEYVAALDFERASWLIKKRLTLASSSVPKASYVTDWQVRLSNVYLAQGKEKESQELFNSIVASLALQGLSADEIRRDRAVLLKRLGKTGESLKLNAMVPSTTGAVIIASPMMAKELIRFGHNSLISSFNSCEQNKSGAARQQFRPPGMRGDPTTIICEGMVAHDSSNVLFGGKIACRQSDFGKTSRWDIVSVPTGITVNDAIRIPQSATQYVQNTSAEGDYTATDLVEPRQLRQPNSSSTFRLFLQDGPGKNEFEGTRGGYRQNSYQQVQVWYNGNKPIKINDFAGLLYAPHAVVHIEFNGHFRGALVARQILLEGNNRIELDRGIVGKNFGQ